MFYSNVPTKFITQSHIFFFFSQDIESVGLITKDIIVIVDREEGGIQRLNEQGFKVHCLLSLNQVYLLYITLYLIIVDNWWSESPV